MRRLTHVTLAAALTVVAGVFLAVPTWAEEPSPAPATPDWSQFDAEAERGIAAYDAGDHDQAKAILLPLAERGHPKAMNMVGLMTHSGHGFSTNVHEACDWYERSAKAGYSSGMYNLSICFNHGQGRPMDQEHMLHWRKLAAQNGSISAMMNLSGLDKERGPEYRRWMIMAAEHGSRYAPVSLWLNGYEDDAWKQGMTIQDFVCVIWHSFIMDEHFNVCD